VKCLFCHREGVKTSREHVVSKPVAALMGLSSNGDLLAFIDPKAQSLSVPALPRDAHVVRGPCAECNGWMAHLDESAASCLRRIEAGVDSLDEGSLEKIASWMLKTFFVFGLKTDHFQMPIADGQLVSKIVANPMQANDLRSGRFDKALAEVHVGLGRYRADWPVAAFGNCSATPPQLALFAGALVIGMPAIDSQLWVVNPSLPPRRVTFPTGVTDLAAGLTWRDRGVGAFPNPEAVRVHFTG
jgi:hypothetical protein